MSVRRLVKASTTALVVGALLYNKSTSCQILEDLGYKPRRGGNDNGGPIRTIVNNSPSNRPLRQSYNLQNSLVTGQSAAGETETTEFSTRYGGGKKSESMTTTRKGIDYNRIPPELVSGYDDIYNEGYGGGDTYEDIDDDITAPNDKTTSTDKKNKSKGTSRGGGGGNARRSREGVVKNMVNAIDGMSLGGGGGIGTGGLGSGGGIGSGGLGSGGGIGNGGLGNGFPQLNLGGIAARGLASVDDSDDDEETMDADEALKQLLLLAEEEYESRQTRNMHHNRQHDKYDADNDNSHMTDTDYENGELCTLRMRAKDGNEINAKVPCSYLDLYGGNSSSSSGTPLDRDDLISNIVNRAAKLNPTAVFKRKRVAKLHTLTEEELELLSDSTDAELEVLTRATDSQIDSLLTAVRSNTGVDDADSDNNQADGIDDVVSEVPVDEMEEVEMTEAFNDCCQKFQRSTCQTLMSRIRQMKIKKRVIRPRSPLINRNACQTVRSTVDHLPCGGKVLNFSEAKTRIVGRARGLIRNTLGRARQVGSRAAVFVKRFGGATPFKACSSGRILSRGLCRDVRPSTVMCLRSQRLFSLDHCRPSLLSNICPLGFELKDRKCLRDFSPMHKCPLKTKLFRGKCVPETNHRATETECPTPLFHHEGHCMVRPQGRMLLPWPGHSTCPEGYQPLKQLLNEENLSKEPNYSQLCGRVVPSNISCPEGYALQENNMNKENSKWECIANRGGLFQENEKCPMGYRYSDTEKMCVKRVKIGFAKLCDGGVFDGHMCHTATESSKECPIGYEAVHNDEGEIEECIKGRNLSTRRRPRSICRHQDDIEVGGICFEAQEISTLCDGGDVDYTAPACTQTVFQKPRKLKSCIGRDCKQTADPIYQCPVNHDVVDSYVLKDTPELCLEIVNALSPKKKIGLGRGGRKLSEDNESGIDDLAFCPFGSTVRVVDDEDEEEERVLCQFANPVSMPQGCDTSHACGREEAKAFCPIGYSVTADNVCVAD